MSQLLYRHFAADLTQLGYPTDDVRYSLGHCQGDGVAFYGSVDAAGLKRLVNRLLPPPAVTAEGDSLAGRLIGAYRARLLTQQHRQRVAALLSQVEVRIGKCRELHLYDHANTMQVEVDVQASADLGDAEATRLSLAADEFRARLADDVRDVSQCLTDEGYALIEATPYEPLELRVFETAQLRVAVRALHDDHYDAPDSGDPEADRADLRDLIDGRSCYCVLEVEIVDKEDKSVIDADRLFGVTLAGKQPSWADRHVKEVAREVLAELRGRMSRRLKRLAMAIYIEDEEVNPS